MYKTIFASAWILTTLAVFVLGVSGRIDPVAVVIFSLIALGLFYAFAVWTVIVNTPDADPRASNSNEAI